MGIRYGASEEIGWRETMEDEHGIYEKPEENFFGAEVYDGHGGRRAATVAVEMLTPHFMHNRARKMERPLRERRRERDLLREAYLAVDTYLVESGIRSGTTAANLYIMEDRFIAANAGDTRIIMGTRKGAVTLTVDHRPSLPEEAARIRAMGGMVTHLGTARVQGMLAVSRSLGDAMLKPYVIAEPRVVEGYLGKENDYALLACDGVWDVLEPEEVIREVRRWEDPRDAAARTARMALDHGSTDNITVIVIDLREHSGNMPRDTMEITTVTDFGADSAPA